MIYFVKYELQKHEITFERDTLARPKPSSA